MFLRKHNRFFTSQEREILRSKLDTCVPHKLSYSPHFFARLSDYDVNTGIMEIHDAIRQGNIIEYKRDICNRDSERFLIRSQGGKKNVVFVLQHTYGNMSKVPGRHEWRLITVWENAASDTRKTLDWSIYDEFDITECV